MKQQLINNIMQQMLKTLNNAQAIELQRVLHQELAKVEFVGYECSNGEIAYNNDELVDVFLAAKRIEGCSEKSLKYYKTTIDTMISAVKKRIQEIDTNDLRTYLTEYQKEKNLSKVTIDNIRRILSSFFSWLEDEDYILKSPVRRIHKVKSISTIKETYTDEMLEIMRDKCDNLRDLALIDILASTGIRVGELVLLNIEDINFIERECVVLGKGNKELSAT